MAGSSAAPSAGIAMKIAAIHLSIAFEIASAMAHAQGTNDPVTQLRACSVLEQAERLECLDKLSRNIAPLPRQAPATDKWIVSETTSPVDYTPIITATALHDGADGSSMQLSIRCRGGRTELAVTGPPLPRSGESVTISYRINHDPAVQLAAVKSSFGAGAAFTGDVVRLLQSLPENGGIAIRLSSRAGAAYDGHFSLSGLKMVRDKISLACRWPQAITTPRN
jgi:hypothetical protein